MKRNFRVEGIYISTIVLILTDINWYYLAYASLHKCDPIHYKKKLQHNFPKWGWGGVKGRLGFFQKIIRFGSGILPLDWFFCQIFSRRDKKIDPIRRKRESRGGWWYWCDKNVHPPGPFEPPERSRPSRKITALSYSWTTWGKVKVFLNLLLKVKVK